MMSAPFPNNRRKRPQSPSSNTNNSFVKSVTEKVSGLLPASISKWFSSPKSANGNTNAADITDSSTDDEDAPITTQSPPAKRMRFSSPGQHNQFSPVDTNWVPPNSFDIKEPLSVPHSSIQTPHIRSMFRHESNYVSTPIRAVNEDSFVENNEQDSSTFKMQHSITSRGLSVATKRELICQSSRNDSGKATPKLNKTQESKQPCFKASLLSSPFYSGRTMYGGASSFYMNESNIKQKKVTLVNESKANDTTTMSHSTRTIMDLLENYSSPLTEARRLPQYIKNPNSDKSNSSAKLPSPGSKEAYKTQELYVPNIASIMQIKQRSRLMDTTSIARQLIASHSSTIGVDPYPAVNKEQDDQEVDTISSLRQYRLKTKLSRKYQDVHKSEEDMPPINLPNVVLQIEPNNLPIFTASLTVITTSVTFASTTSSITSTSFTNAPPATSTMVFLTSDPITVADSRTTYRSSKANNISSKGMFKFSNPDPVVCNLPTTTKQTSSCKFGTIEKENDNIPSLLHSNDEQEGVIVMPNAKKDLILLNMLNEQKHSDCCINNRSDIDKCLCSGGKKPEAVVNVSIKCVVCNHANAQKQSDMCASCEMKKIDASEIKPKEIVNWKCEDCWVGNKETDQKCVCCGASKPNSLIPVMQKSGTINTTENDWKCINCSSLNKDSLEKCMKCGENKTTSKVNNTAEDSSMLIGKDTHKTTLFPSIKPTDDVFTNIVKSQKNEKWECSSCLVKNEKDKSVCICCGTDKEKENTAGNKILFNFNTTESSKFKFGIYNNEPQVAEMDNLMEEESLPEVPKSIETIENNIIEEMSTISNNHFEDKAEFSKEVEDESNKAKFGLPESTSVLPLDIIEVPSENSDSNLEKENTQDMPKINFEYEEKYKENSFFALYNSKSKDLGTPKSISFTVPSISSQDNKTSKEIPTLPAYPLPAITASPQISPSQNNFRFSTSKLNLSGNPFESPVVTTAVTTISFLMPSHSVTTTIAASTIGDTSLFPKLETKIPDTASLFSKKDDVPTTAIPLFQKSESGVKTAQTTVTTTPIFNFGSNTQTGILPAPVEKPKFNFVFGNNNTTENSPIFKRATFSTMPDNDAGSNKFTLSSGNTLGAGTGLFGNPLPGNGLPSGSTLTAVTLPTTTSLGGKTDVAANTISGGSSLQTNTTMTGVFGTSGQKENMWSSNNNMSNNLFVANTTVSTLQKPSPFTFGTSSPFNANNTTSSFGSNTQTTQNLFGIPSQTKGTPQPAMFSSSGQNQTTSNIFGSPTSASNPTPSLATIFGTQNVGTTPAFGSPNPPVPSFEAPSVNPAPTPAFNFGGAPSTNILSFGQQQQPQQAGVFGFVGGPAAVGPQVQFNMGTAPNTATRRVRKAVRRNPQR